MTYEYEGWIFLGREYAELCVCIPSTQKEIPKYIRSSLIFTLTHIPKILRVFVYVSRSYEIMHFAAFSLRSDFSREPMEYSSPPPFAAHPPLRKH